MGDDEKERLSVSSTNSGTHTTKAKETLDECSENSDVETPRAFEVQLQSENANTFSYLLGLFENPCPSGEAFGKPLDFANVTLETRTQIIVDEAEITKDIEDELFIKSTEPASNSLILNIEQNTSENNVALKNSKHQSAASQKTQPIPSITPSKIKSQAHLENVIGNQISRDKENQKIHKNHEGKQGSAIDSNNTEMLKIQEQNNEKEPQSTVNLLTLKKNSENYEANITISFKFLNNQGSQLQHVHQKIIDNDAQSEVLKEIALNSVDVATSSYKTSPISLITKLSFTQDAQRSNEPLLILSGSITSRSSQPETTKPIKAKVPSLTSPVSLITTEPKEPQSLFLQALTKLTESSISVTILNRRQENATSPISNISTTNRSVEPFYAECSPPNSSTCAPPSYSFVIRQSARRRPRFMGTFISSPSFIRKIPPPTYAAAFDLCGDSPPPPQTTRMFAYGFTETLVVCPECGYTGLSSVISKVTFCTHICAFLLCLFCCWICAPLPYILRSCKDVYHYCRNCRNLLGIYRPYTPENAYNVP